MSLKTQEGYRYGYINDKHKKVLDVNYNSIYRVLEVNDKENVYLIATKNGQAGIVKNGQEIVNYTYQKIQYDDYNHLFILERGQKVGATDASGKEIIPTEYKEITTKGIYLQAIGTDETITYFDAQGNKIDTNYESVLRTENENYFITMDLDGRYGIIDAEKQVILENTYQYLEYLYEDYFIASNEKGNLGVINKQGEIKIDFEYEALQKLDHAKVLEAKNLTEDITVLYSDKLEKIYTKQNALIYSYENYVEAYSQDEISYFHIKC